MRLFVALDLDNTIRGRIAGFVEAMRGFAPEARWVKSESLHVTLKFIGEQPDTSIDQITRALASINAISPKINFHGFGFFPTAKAARVFWMGMEAGPELAALAGEVEEKFVPLGIPEEQRKFSPHLTLARSPGGSGSPRWKGDRPRNTFHLLQERLAAQAEPEFGSMTAHEFFLYRSQLSPKGSKYTKLASFPLG